MLPLKVAIRFLKSGRSQTILIVLGIAVGVAVQVFVGSLIGSLQSTLLDRTIGNSSQVTVVSADENSTAFDGWQNMVARIGRVSSTKSVCVVADSPAFLLRESAGWNRSAQIILRGFNLQEAEGIYKFNSALIGGRLPGEGEVLVGKNLRDDWDISNAETLKVQTPHGTANITVVGFYDFKVASVNSAWLITTLATSQEASGFGNKVTAIEMQVTDVFKADEVARQVENALADPSVKVLNWKDQNQELLSGLQGQSISSTLIQLFVLASVAIAIASVLAITVVQKSRQIGIMKAMGVKDRSASMVFLYEGLMLGVAGAIAGVLLGLFLLLGFQFGSSKPGQEALIDLRIDYVFILASAVIAVVAALVAALLPARMSSRLSPIEVIRNG